MSLLDDLRAVGKYIDRSLLPNENEIVQLVGALIHTVEHPDLKQTIKDGQSAGKSDAEVVTAVSNVISPPPPEPTPQQPAADSGQSEDVTALQARIAQLEQQAQIRQASEQHPTAASEPYDQGQG